jgi:hypothetical protein
MCAACGTLDVVSHSQACAPYLAGACVNIALLTSAEKIVIGGGVLNRKCLYPMIRAEVQSVLNGYIATDQITTAAGIAKYIAPGVHGNDAGIIGALALAEMAYGKPAPAPTSAAAAGGVQRLRRLRARAVNAARKWLHCRPSWQRSGRRTGRS